MSDKDYIKDLFSEKLGNYEAKVNPELWNGIASQIGGAAGTTVATGLSVAAKWMIGVGVAGVLTVTTLVVVNSTTDEIETPVEKIAETNLEDNEVRDDEQLEITTIDSEEYGSNDVAQAVQSEQSDFVESDEVGEENEGILPLPDYILEDFEEQVFETPGPQVDSEDVFSNETSGDVLGGDGNGTEVTDVNTTNEVDPIIEEELMPEEFEAEEKTSETVQYKIDRLPNVFTPNGDGENDYFSIKSSNLSEFSITVLSSENKVVFQSSNPDFIWDGNDLSGSPVPDGNYVYFISAKEFSKEKPKRYSPLLIKRSR